MEGQNGPKNDKFLVVMKEFIKSFVVSLVIVFVLTFFVIRPVRVDGHSMDPTLVNHDIGFSNVLGLNFGNISRFDILVVYLEKSDKFLVKRVIGLPGDTVEYREDRLYINGEYVEEPFIAESPHRVPNTEFTLDFGPYVVGENEYFLLGDNRNHSSDSRDYGMFSRDDIKSKGVFVIFPFSNFGLKGW